MLFLFASVCDWDRIREQWTLQLHFLKARVSYNFTSLEFEPTKTLGLFLVRSNGNFKINSFIGVGPAACDFAKQLQKNNKFVFGDEIIFEGNGIKFPKYVVCSNHLCIMDEEGNIVIQLGYNTLPQ